MNERIRELMLEAGYAAPEIAVRAQKFAQLIVRECDRLNRTQSYELLGVVVDVSENNVFDAINQKTIQRVENYLYSGSLTKHFGF